MVFRDDVADPDAPARLEDPPDLGQHGRLVDRQVDHAVGDHHVDRVRGQRNLLDDALEEVRVRDSRVARVLLGEGKHLVRHVQPVGDPGGPDPLGREDHVDSAPGAEVEHGVALVEVRDGGRVSAPERRQRRRLRQLAALLGVVQRFAERTLLTVAAGVSAAAAVLFAPTSARRRRSRGLGVAEPHLLAQLIGARRHQQHAPFRSATTASVSTASRFNEK